MDPSPDDAPILENGLGTIQLGDSLNAVQAKLGQPVTQRAGKIPSEGLEILDYKHICVILEDGSVSHVLALEGYRGETEDGLSVGMMWRDLERRAPQVTFDEELYGWVIPERPWLELTIVRPTRERDVTFPGETTDEYYEVTDPDHARVTMIAVAPPRRSSARVG